MIYVSGEDYSALNFEQSEFGVEEAWNKAMEEGGTWSYENDDEELYFDIEAYEFNNVDPRFIVFIHNEMIDEDSAKHYNFYCFEE